MLVIVRVVPLNHFLGDFIKVLTKDNKGAPHLRFRWDFQLRISPFLSLEAEISPTKHNLMLTLACKISIAKVERKKS